MNPVELASGDRVAQWLESYHLSTKTPVVLMRRPRRGSLFQWQPACSCPCMSHSSTVSQATKSDMKLLRAKARWPYLGQILELKQNLTICAFAIAMYYGLALFV